MTPQQTDIVVIGAGLTGLTTAHYLNKAGKNFLVIDRNPFVGGAIQTTSEDGFTFEKGPSTGVMSNETVGELFEDLKGLCTLERAADTVNKRYVLKDGRWEALPSGLMGGITTPLFTLYDKLRILGEPFRKAGTNPNETLAELVKRRMGNSFLDYAIDPFIIGVYAGDPAYLVPRFALPKLYNLEQKYGSFIGGAIKMGREKAKTQPKPKKKESNRIFSVEGGLTNFMKALQQSAGEDKFILGINNLTITPENGQYTVKGTNAKGEEIVVQAKQVITTVGAHELEKMLPFVEKTTLDKITNLLYAKVVQVSLGFKQWSGFELDAFGGLISFKEKRDILGVLFPSAFLKNRAPEGGAMLSVFMGGVRRPEMHGLSDETILQYVEKEMCSIMGLKSFNPDLVRIFRYREAIPQYGADCEARFEAVDQIEKQNPGFLIGGNLRNGIGMADRILQGKNLALNVK